MGLGGGFRFSDFDKMTAELRLCCFFTYFFRGGGVAFFRGVFEKRGGRRWFFDGEFVVFCVVKMAF